jgi:UDP-glucose 4-epimerase
VKIVVTGGAGFIGSNLVRRLGAAGVDVAVLDDFSTGYRTNLEGTNCRVWEGSILDSDLLGLVTQGAHSIVHLAAVPSVPRSVKDPITSHEANATGTLRVLEAARRHGGHVVVASSSSVYGDNPAMPKIETLRPQPVSPYAVSKLAAESYALSYQRVYGLPVIPFRFFNVYGPYQAAGHAYAAVVPAFIDAALRGSELCLHGDGEQTRDFTFVDTVTEVLAAAAIGRVCSTEPVNLAFGTRHSLNQVIAMLESILKLNLSVKHVEERAGDVRDSQADNQRLMTLFPTIEPVPLITGLAAAVDWMESADVHT